MLKALTLATLIAFSAPAAFAKEAAPAPVAKLSPAAERKEVKAAFAAWREALSGGKAEPVVALYTKDAVLLATLANDPITDQADRTAYFTNLTAKPKLKARVNEEFVRLLDEDDAVLSGTYTFSFEDAGKTVSIPARYTLVYKKLDGKWMIVEHHSSKMPMDK
jgi:uncharacterized protein (TIGR02246 family)